MKDTIHAELLAKVGGIETFARNWSWRSHSPRQRAEGALDGAATDIAAGLAVLAAAGISAELADAWKAKAYSLWLAYQAAGARTANPMITGPANFPTARNQKAMIAERKRGEEWFVYVTDAKGWIARREKQAKRAELSAESAQAEHCSIDFPGVKLVQNTTLDRVQLVFDGKPEPDTIKLLKSAAFRWSPRETAWQRQNTNNGVQAAYRVLRALGHGSAA